MRTLTLDQVHALAATAHAGQVDKIGIPYIRHLEAVAEGVSPFGQRMQMAGLLHDIIEDTYWDAYMLIEAGVPTSVVSLVEAVTNTPGQKYLDKIRSIAQKGPLPALLKIADNAHNTRPDRTLPVEKMTPEFEEKQALRAEKYRKAQRILWQAAPKAQVEKVLAIVNPSLVPLHNVMPRMGVDI